MKTDESSRGTICKNCQTALPNKEKYCPNCGQKNDVRRLSLIEYITETLGNFFSFDSKVIQSLIPLLTRPGYLARQYVEGKKNKFVMPFRMFMFFSILFFLSAGFADKVDDDFLEEGVDDTEVVEDKMKTSATDTLYPDTLKIDPDSLLNRWDALFFSFENAKLSTPDALAKMKVPINAANVKTYDEWSRFVKIDKKEFFTYLVNKLPMLIFLFMPILALALKLFYIRRDIYYSEHLTFLLYTNSMIFLLGFLVIVFRSLVHIDLGTWAFFAYSIYFLVAMKNFYQQRWFKTIVKYFLVGFSHIILIPIFAAVSIIVMALLY